MIGFHHDRLSSFTQNLQGLTGTAMVAGSPIRHENTVQGNPVEVQTYQPPWKSLSDFALQSDLEQPAFQQLVLYYSFTVTSNMNIYLLKIYIVFYGS